MPKTASAVSSMEVLILNTGGTINMILGQRGYVPEPYFLTESLRTQNRFHDPLEESLFSHSSSAQLPSMITPRSTAPGGIQKRVRYAVLEWDPLLDSSNIEITDWIRIATEIELNYAAFDAFVILHGTDTMSYTSSALSFLLEDLGKTVIVTGAQIPLSQLRNDAVDNLLGALVLAGHYIIPECCLFFNHTLYRGNRVSKISSYDLNAFASPNFPPLVNVGIDIVVNWNDVMRQTSLRRFRSHKATLRLFPGITAATVRAFLAPETQGVVLETYGAGNAPQRSDLVGALKEACDRGVVIVSISQCAKGSVSDAYETGRSLLSAGVVSGGDMTPECALTKLSYLLSKPELSFSEVRALVGTPLRGELTRPVSVIPPRSASQGHRQQPREHLRGALAGSPALLRPDPRQTRRNIAIGGGLVNCVEPASRRSPLHSAALNGSAGALVHLRDSLGHTPLYYAARQGHEQVVEVW
ncbi:asparaginase-domain-containing protein [Fomitopsis serialis]|uniref:asparaginase-domain-containing protein n=1 Tax=Fomitopsis serialis TaxID=139415 RepID=UPI0020073FE7|nr:asparaginase-domain-containing protein [Neoantrodia serialis]KAH9930599.1 asparaginase-domain-containing protein [Neoantrodia serialis]